MFLNDEEKRILDGAEGYLAQKCMKFLVAYGEAADAEKLIDIDGTADVHPGTLSSSWAPDTAITFMEVQLAAKRGEKFKVPTFSNKPFGPSFFMDGWEKTGTYPGTIPSYHQKCMEDLIPYMRMGMVPILACDYYLVSSYTPTVGQTCSWGESSAIPWCNAVLGARTNYDGCFATAYLGKVPKHDMHIDENRVATVLVRSECELKSDMEYDLFGWVVGEKLGLRVPALVGTGKPTTTQLVKMNTSLSTAGQVRMYHMPGVTPEASTVEHAFRGKAPKEEIVITRADLQKAYEETLTYATDRNVDFVFFGCPHANIIEVQKVARLIEGKRCRSNLWMSTNPWSYRQAEMMGIVDIFDRAGAVLLSAGCIGEMQMELPPMAVMATDSAKMNYYLPPFAEPRKLQAWYGSTEDCVNAALTGKWEGAWR